MAETREGRIYDVLMERVSTQPTDLHVVYPGVVYPDEAKREKRADYYIMVNHAPNRPERVGIGTERGSHNFRGIVSMSVMSPLGVGIADVVELAGKLAAHFPADLRLSAEGIILRVAQEPYVAQGYRDGERWRTPVIVDYETVTA